MLPALRHFQKPVVTFFDDSKVLQEWYETLHALGLRKLEKPTPPVENKAKYWFELFYRIKFVDLTSLELSLRHVDRYSLLAFGSSLLWEQ